MQSHPELPVKQNGFLLVLLIEGVQSIADIHDRIFEAFRPVDRHQGHAASSCGIAAVGRFPGFAKITDAQVEPVQALITVGLKALGKSQKMLAILAGSVTACVLTQKDGSIRPFQY
jgi:hypothetical protein